ncbi:MAG: nucleoside recognition domain-containing protein [Myxococcota bacterium]
MNWIFAGLIIVSVLTGAFTGRMGDVTKAGIDSAKAAVDLSIGLIGQMALWLGFFGVLRQAGLVSGIARVLTPVMRRLFPDLPPDHPALGAMIMNIAANVLGLGNAATPFGLKAMQELDSLNTRRGVATNSMALFLAINTSGVAVLPLGAVAVRATLGSKDPAGIILPTLIATACSTIAAVLIAKALEKRAMFAPERYADVTVEAAAAKAPDAEALRQAEALAALRPAGPLWKVLFAAAVGAAMVVALGLHVAHLPPELGALEATRGILGDWLLPLLMLVIVLVGFGRDVKVYEAFIGAAKEGFQVGVVIIPFLVAILVGVGMFRASGAMDALTGALAPVLRAAGGFPPEALPMALVRPLSGNGALGVMTEVMKTHGPDSFVGYLVSTIMGGTETTFYVLALYFGSVQVKALRHTLLACVAADFVGPIAAFLACKVMFGHLA